MRSICTSIVATLVLAGTSFAATINVPGDYATIQGAINASSNGDTIAIAAGTYYEHSLNPSGKAITIGSASGNPDVTIDANGGGTVFMIDSGEGNETVIKNLVITGGNGTEMSGYIVGGGIYCNNNSNPTITDCTIEGNTAGYGGGIYCNDSGPTISNCGITGNEANYFGGGIMCQDNSSPTISECTISGNTAGYGGGGILCDNSTPISGNPTISGCTISDNTAQIHGGGIACYNSNPTITDCTISDNTADYDGGGIYCGNIDLTISGGSVCGNSPNQTFVDETSSITSGLCWIAESCDGNPYFVIANQQEQINQLLTMHDQQQSAIEELQQVIEACCVERTCTGDENKDGVVNIEDLLIVISVWGPCP